MVGAVKKGYFDVHYRETSQYPIGKRLLQTFFHRRNIFARYGSTLDGVDKLKTFTCLVRLHLEPDMTILPAPARLLDELAFDLHRFFDCFAISHLRSANIGFHSEFPLHPVYNNFEMQFTHTGNDGLTRFFIGTNTERG